MGGNLPAKNLTINFQAYQITLACLGSNDIRLELNPKPRDARMRLVGIVDDRGAKVEHAGGWFDDDRFDAQWMTSPEAESIRITIALAETHHFELVAQPLRQ